MANEINIVARNLFDSDLGHFVQNKHSLYKSYKIL